MSVKRAWVPCFKVVGRNGVKNTDRMDRNIQTNPCSVLAPGEAWDSLRAEH